jgi:branched-chain amino acid transport system substrate-binding protein
MTNKRWLRALAVVAVLSIVAAACGDDDDTTTDTQAPGDTTEDTTEDTTDGTSAPSGGTQADGVFKIGYLLPQTGALGFLGPPMIEAVRMAVEEINAAGGVNGEEVVLVGQDDGTDADIANAGADALLADGVDMIVGPAGSSVALAVIDKITGASVPMCSPSNTGVQFTTYDDNGFYFRTAPPDNLQAQVLTDLIIEDGHSDVVVLGQATEYGEGFANFLAEFLTAAGATVPAPIIYDPDAGSFSDVATQIADADPDAVAIISYDEGAQVMKDAIAAGVGPGDVQWYGADGIQSSKFWELVDPNDASVVEGVRGTAPSAAPADGEPTFRERFEAFAPGTDTIFSGHAYDCTVIGALAAAAAGTDASAAVAAEINGVTREGEKCTLVADCLALLAEGTDVDYDGAAGPLDFVDAGEPGAGAYDTWTFAADGSVEVIEASIPVAGDG